MIFFMKSAMWMCHDLDSSLTWEGNWIWKTNIPPKLKIFLWQIFHNGLPVRGTLLKREMKINATCPLCHEDIETFEHLFVQCSYAKKQRKGILHFLIIGYPGSYYPMNLMGGISSVYSTPHSARHCSTDPSTSFGASGKHGIIRYFVMKHLSGVSLF